MFGNLHISSEGFLAAPNTKTSLEELEVFNDPHASGWQKDIPEWWCEWYCRSKNNRTSEDDDGDEDGNGDHGDHFDDGDDGDDGDDEEDEEEEDDDDDDDVDASSIAGNIIHTPHWS